MEDFLRPLKLSKSTRAVLDRRNRVRDGYLVTGRERSGNGAGPRIVPFGLLLPDGRLRIALRQSAFARIISLYCVPGTPQGNVERAETVGG